MEDHDWLSLAEANHLTRWYCCSKCYKSLDAHYEPDPNDPSETRAFVFCNDCGEGQGFIKNGTAERIRREDHSRFVMAGDNLRQILMLPPTDQEIEEAYLENRLFDLNKKMKNIQPNITPGFHSKAELKRIQEDWKNKHTGGTRCQ